MAGKEEESAEEKSKTSVEDIGGIVKASGFEATPEELESAKGLLTRLGDFMTIEGKGGLSSEDMVKKLQREGVLTEKQAKEALVNAKKAQKSAGGIKFTEDTRKSINFSRTCVSHVDRLITSLME